MVLLWRVVGLAPGLGALVVPGSEELAVEARPVYAASALCAVPYFAVWAGGFVLEPPSYLVGWGLSACVPVADRFWSRGLPSLLGVSWLGAVSLIVCSGLGGVFFPYFCCTAFPAPGLFIVAEGLLEVVDKGV